MTALRTAAIIGLLTGISLPAQAAYEEMLNSEQLYQQGFGLREQGKIKEAILNFQLSIDKNSDTTFRDKSVRALGDIYLEPGPFRNLPKGVEIMERAALDNKDASAAAKLAALQMDGVIKDPPHVQALIPLYEQAARDSSNSAALLMARFTREKRVGIDRSMTETSWTTIAANRGSQTAIHNMVTISLAGGRESDALAWVKKMKPEDAAGTYVDVARSYLTGDGLKQNTTAAVRWYQLALAADAGKAVRSASRFLDVEIPEATRNAILVALKREADKGNPDAALLVAKNLDQADPTKVNPDAVRYFIVAAKAGNGDAVEGLTKNSGFLQAEDPLAGKLIDGVKAAAAKSNTKAMLALANYYAVGSLVEQDAKQSFAWYLKAAKAGDSEAEFRAGMAYANGLGTDANKGEAKRWLLAADKHGYPLAKPSLQQLETATQ